MSEELICPDCGGVIGGEPGAGRQVCRCFEERRTVTADPAPMVGEELSGSGSGAASGEKVCRICGKNLKGHRRLKDSRGYTCVACSEIEQVTGVDRKLIPCPECKRKLKIDGITTYNGQVMCKRCAAGHKERDKFKPPVAAYDVRQKKAQLASLRNLLIIAGVLLVIIVLSYFGLIGRH